MTGKQKFPVLRGRIRADAVIVGGGLTGMTAAVWLAKAGIKAAVVEADRIDKAYPEGMTAALSPAQGMMYAELEKRQGGSAVQAYAQTHLGAIQSICELVQRQRIHFALRKVNGVIAADRNADLEKEAEAMKRAGIAASIRRNESERLLIQPVYTLGFYSYLQALAAMSVSFGVKCYEDSRVIGVETDVVYAERGSVQAPYVIIATGYPIINTPGWYFLRMNQRRKTAFYLRNGRLQQEAVFSADQSFTAVPAGNGTLLYIREEMTGGGGGEFQRRVVGRWKTELQAQTAERTGTYTESVTPDGLPYIGPYSARTPHLFVGTGYGGDGLAGSMIAAQAITARVLGLPSDDYEIYLPQRSISDLGVPARIAGRYFKGLFGDSDTPRCSHMGCKLVFNAASRLWECPCHGSRFDDIGRVVNAPATQPVQLRGRK